MSGRRPAPPPPRLALTIQEAGQALALGEDQIEALLRSGALPYLTFGARGQIRIPVVALERYIEDRLPKRRPA